VASHQISSQVRFVGDNDTTIFLAQLRKYHCQSEIRVQDGLQEEAYCIWAAKDSSWERFWIFRSYQIFQLKIRLYYFFVHEPIEVKF
jgi:hypothetical protein